MRRTGVVIYCSLEISGGTYYLVRVEGVADSPMMPRGTLDMSSSFTGLPHKHRHSLSYPTGKLFGDILWDETLANTQKACELTKQEPNNLFMNSDIL